MGLILITMITQFGIRAAASLSVHDRIEAIEVEGTASQDQLLKRLFRIDPLDLILVCSQPSLLPCFLPSSGAKRRLQRVVLSARV